MKYNLPFYETAKSEYLSDTETVRKTFRLAILAEQVIKFHTAVIVQNFLQSKDVRAEGKAYLGRGLSRPSLGLWAFFTEMIFPMIETEDLYWRDFPEYFQSIGIERIKPKRSVYFSGWSGTPTNNLGRGPLGHGDPDCKGCDNTDYPLNW